MSYKKKYDYDKRYLITLNLYNHNIPFKKPSSGKLETIKDYNEFIMNNKDLIHKIYSVEDDLIRIGGALNEDYDTIDDVLNNVLLKILTDKKVQGGQFDDYKFKDDFYNEPINKFKSLFHN